MFIESSHPRMTEVNASQLVAHVVGKVYVRKTRRGSRENPNSADTVDSGERIRRV